MTGPYRIVPLGHTNLAGRPDGVQVVVSGQYAYVGHLSSDGITVVDVSDATLYVTDTNAGLSILAFEM